MELDLNVDTGIDIDLSRGLSSSSGEAAASNDAPSVSDDEADDASGRRTAQRLWGLTLLTIIGAMVLYSSATRHVHGVRSPHRLPWLVLIVIFYAVEANVVHVHFQREAHSFSLSEIPLVLGLFFASPTHLIVAQVVGAGLALLVHRRQSPLKLLFNLGQFALSTQLAVLLFTWFVPAVRPDSTAGWGAAFLATWAGALAGLFMITVAISVSEGRLHVQRLHEIAGLGMLSAATNASLGLVAITVLWDHPDGVLLLLVPVGALFLAYRAYIGERDRRETLQFLYDSSRMLHGQAEVDTKVQELLTQTAQMFRAEVTEITLFPDHDGGPALRIALGPGGRANAIERVDLDPEVVQLATAAANDGGLLLTDSSRHSRKVRLTDRRLREAMVAALPGESGPLGVMVVGNRLDDVSTFDTEDLRLFETLANHVSVAIENGHLEQAVAEMRDNERELSHRAFHDPLTDLANRALFTTRVDEAITRRSHRPLAVLFVDLDDFKAVNDRLGHAAGDEVLLAVAHRIKSCIRPSDVAARLGGDEFAVLLETGGTMEAVRVARRLVDVLATPVAVDGGLAAIGGSVGVAFGVPGRHTAAQVLAEADAAMYRAKARGKGSFEVADTALQPPLHTAPRVESDPIIGEIIRSLATHPLGES